MIVGHVFDFDFSVRYTLGYLEGSLQHPAVSHVVSAKDVDVLGRRIISASPPEALLSCDVIFRPDDELAPRGEFDKFFYQYDLWPRTIICDEKDDYTGEFIERQEGVLYHAKRTVKQLDGVLSQDYALLDAYLGFDFDDRPIDIACLFVNVPELDQSYTIERWNMLQALIAADIPGNHYIGQQTTRNGRPELLKPRPNEFTRYMNLLGSSKIVVTATPSHRTGDSRLWEAFASGALVVADLPDIPTAHPFVDGVHCITFDGRDHRSISDAIEKIKYYLNHGEEREAIAIAGRDHALAHHRAINRFSELMEVVSEYNRRNN